MLSYFDTLDEALAYANEVAGYRELWDIIMFLEAQGVLSAN